MKDNEVTAYAGFTIGPIYDMMSHARKTRELWFSSYFFSWFMEDLISRLSALDGVEFLTPYVEGKKLEPNHSKAGMYHDRFIIESTLDKESLFYEVDKATKETLDNFVDLIDMVITTRPEGYISGASKNSIKIILDGYIQRNFVVLDSSLIDASTKVKSVDQYLNSMEENRSFHLGDVTNTCHRCKTLPGVAKPMIYDREVDQDKSVKHLCPLCFIKYFCYSSSEIQKKVKEGSSFRYPPILDIAARELLTNAVRASSSKFTARDKDYNFKDIEIAIKDINKEKSKEEKIKIRPYHKYFAIVQADGDNLTKLAAQISDARALSGRLFNFTKEAKRIIESYGGEPIYIGGDDILAFMPVAMRDGNGCLRTVFDFAVNLSDSYRAIINQGINEASSLSVGINIAYYKYPLSRALEGARDQLQNNAKAGQKNALAIRLTKHSGFQADFKFAFGSNEISSFSKLLGGVLSGKTDMPQAIHHNLSRSLEVLANIPDKDRLKAFFDNNFNEQIHHKKFEEGLNLVNDLFFELLDAVETGKEKRELIKELLNKLRFVKFLRGDK